MITLPNSVKMTLYKHYNQTEFINPVASSRLQWYVLLLLDCPPSLEAPYSMAHIMKCLGCPRDKTVLVNRLILGSFFEWHHLNSGDLIFFLIKV